MVDCREQRKSLLICPSLCAKWEPQSSACHQGVLGKQQQVIEMTATGVLYVLKEGVN